MVGDLTGILIIRACIEEGSSEPLRAQVRLSTDVSTGYERMLTFTRPEAVGALVEEWLTNFMQDAKRIN